MTKKIHVDGSFGRSDSLESTQGMIAEGQDLEAKGFDGLMIAEINHDPFIPLAFAAHGTEKISLRTAIAVAFARSPMTVANSAHDLNALSKGRFTLGLGSQIRPHITKRFSMPWHGPAKQMREYLESLNAIFDCWYDGKELNYEGEFYKFTLMTPEFTPKNTEHGRPKILLAAVGPLMMQTAAAVADGLIVHPFCTEGYFKNQMLPRIEQELQARGKTLDDFEIQYPAMIATGTTEEAYEKSREAWRYRIGFYGSTPAYKPVLAEHGWGDLQPLLNRMTKDGKWDQLAGEISDEMLETFACVGAPTEAMGKVKERFGGYIDRITLDSNAPADALSQQLGALRA